MFHLTYTFFDGILYYHGATRISTSAFHRGRVFGYEHSSGVVRVNIHRLWLRYVVFIRYLAKSYAIGNSLDNRSHLGTSRARRLRLLRLRRPVKWPVIAYPYDNICSVSGSVCQTGLLDDVRSSSGRHERDVRCVAPSWLWPHRLVAGPDGPA